jgi:hypothetical protein
MVHHVVHVLYVLYNLDSKVPHPGALLLFVVCSCAVLGMSCSVLVLLVGNIEAWGATASVGAGCQKHVADARGMFMRFALHSVNHRACPGHLYYARTCWNRGCWVLRYTWTASCHVKVACVGGTLWNAVYALNICSAKTLAAGLYVEQTWGQFLYELALLRL